MSTVDDLGSPNLQQVTRVYNLEINIPYKGNARNGNVLSQNQANPLIVKYTDVANQSVTVYDPVVGGNVTISIVGLMAAIQQFGQ
jgi:hypothetical protein